MGAPLSPAAPLAAKPADPSKQPRHWWFRWRWFFLVVELLLVIFSAVWIFCFEKHLPASLTFGQLIYGLISLDLSVAIYIYGVGPLSPHWRPRLSAQPTPDAAKVMLGPASAEAAAHDHPLGPSSSASVNQTPAPNQQDPNVAPNPGQNPGQK